MASTPLTLCYTLHIGSFAVASLVHSWFVNNMGSDVGLALSENNSVTLTIDTCSFDGSLAQDIWALDLPDVSRLTVANSVIRGYAGEFFPPLVVCSSHGLDKRFTLDNVTFFNNTAGGVHVKTKDILVQINGCHFDSNGWRNYRSPSDTPSDILHINSGATWSQSAGTGITLWLTNSTFESNIGARGSMQLEYLDCIAVVNVTFRNNTAGTAGAATIDGTGGQPFECAVAAAYVDGYSISDNAFDNRQFPTDGNVSSPAQWAFSPASISGQSTASIGSFVTEPYTS